ncbi:MAG: copper chaperone PCu(A)C [Asticcacaulis sp.]
MMKMTLAALACVLILPLSACDKPKAPEPVHDAAADSAVHPDSAVKVVGLSLTHYAMRAALGNNPNTAAYVTITNSGDSDDHLVSARCACATTTSLHSMKMTGTTMEMADMPDGFDIKKGETLTLAPGGNHIMLEGLTKRPQAGEVVDLTLTFKKAGDVTLHVPVSDTPLSDHKMDHGDMKM